MAKQQNAESSRGGGRQRTAAAATSCSGGAAGTTTTSTASAAVLCLVLLSSVAQTASAFSGPPPASRADAQTRIIPGGATRRGAAASWTTGGSSVLQATVGIGTKSSSGGGGRGSTELSMGLFSGGSAGGANRRRDAKSGGAVGIRGRWRKFVSDGGGGGGANDEERRVGAMRKVLSRARERLRSLLVWERRRRRSTIAAAAMLLSAVTFVLSGGGMMVDGLPSSSVQQGQSGPQVVAVAKTSAAAAQSSEYAERMAGSMRVSGGGTGSMSADSNVLKRGVRTLRRATTAVAEAPRGAASKEHVVSARARATAVSKSSVALPRTGSTAASKDLPLAAALPKANSKDGNNKDSLEKATERTIREAIIDLKEYMAGPKSDTLILLLATALVTPLCKQIGTSPILGFLAAGMLLGPNAFGLISGIHTTETLAELGIVFFLFEMGIELSFDRLKAMQRDVFGLGLSQFLTTAAAVAAIGRVAFGLPGNALVVLGGGLALSSSAFVLQLLKDKDQLATRFGKASFGVLLFQDLAVVPLLVVTPILAGGGQGLAAALGSAFVKASIALGSIAFAGRVLLNPLFNTVAKAKTQEAFLGVVLLTVLGMSFLTEGLGLSNTLGAFLAGVLLSETKYRYQIEADIAPFRGILLGLFFVTVGFEIDVKLVMSQLPLVSAVVLGIVAVKASIATLLSMAFGLSPATSQQTGLILSQAGEFAFVAFGLARNLGILDKQTTKFLLTCVSLTMALTPFLAEAGSRVAKRLEEGSDFDHYLGQDREAMELKESDDFVIVIGYGTVGRVVCDLLDRKFIRYVGLEVNPNKAIDARNRGLPVFYGDVGRPEVAEAFNVGNAKAVIVTIADKAEANRAVIALRRMYPEMKIFSRAKDADHAQRLQKTLDVAAMVPIVPEDNVLLTLPFGGAVLKSLGAAPEEVNAILEAKRKDLLSGRGLAESEEETALFQLGITTEDDDDKKKKQEAKKEAAVIDAETVEEKEDEALTEEQELAAIAAAAVEESKEKNPMVASVIEANISELPKKKAPAAIDVEVETSSDVATVVDVDTVPNDGADGSKGTE